MTERKRLDGWKEIADFLQKSVRTTQRLEKEGLPIYRLPNKKSVFTYDEDILNWLNKDKSINENEIDLSSIEKKLYLNVFNKGTLTIFIFFIFSISIVGTILVNKYFLSKGNKKLHYKIREYDDKVVYDILNEKDKVVCSFENRLPYNNILKKFNKKLIILEDLNKDGLDDIIYLNSYVLDKNRMEILYQNKIGKFKSIKNIDLDLSFSWKNILYSSFYPIDMDYYDINQDGEKEIIVAQDSSPYFPSVLRIFNFDKMKELMRIYHPGHIFNFIVKDIDKDGFNEIYVAGTNNRIEEQYSYPIFFKLKINKLQKKLQEINLFDKKNPITNEIPKNITVTYLNLCKDKTKNMFPWEVAFIPEKTKDNLANCDFKVLASGTRYNIYGKLRQDGSTFLRNFHFDKDFNLKDYYYSEPYLMVINKKESDPEIQELSKIKYWNGTAWQSEKCNIPNRK